MVLTGGLESGPDMRNVDSVALRETVRAVFLALGSSTFEAEKVADHLVESNLRGHDSHGVGLLPNYVEASRNGELRLNQELSVARTSGAILVCDADHGVGQVMAYRAMEHGIAHAREHGSAIVALRNSYHIGRIGHWAEQCAAAGFVSVHFVNVISAPLVVPFGGTKPRLSTNPFAAGFPRGDGQPPIIADFATSNLALGKVRVAHSRGVSVPDGTLVDAEGRPTNDPNVMFSEPRGALLPFGGHKGAALSLTCELLGAALAGAVVHSGPMEGSALLNSMTSIIIDPDAMSDAYLAALGNVADWYRSEADAPDTDIMLPGEPELRTRTERLVTGIPIESPTLDAIIETARRVGVRDIQLAAN